MADLLLGAGVDRASHQRTDSHVMLRASDLTTHGVIVGMTGSGKTGLGVVLIEECLRAGVPALLIDPKGDLTNLCLTFPRLAPDDFRPWVNEGDAQRAGQSLDDFAATQATAWRDGLATWELGPQDITALRSAVDLTIYTPGSSSGVPLNIVGSLDAPAPGTDAETMADEIDGYVSSLLGMLGINADPLSSREHILLANLINSAWTQGRGLDLPTLLAQVQQPPLRKLGVLDVDTFFPPNDRAAFAMRLNGLLAAPTFAAWMAGDPVDIDRMLRTPDGRPRAAIVTTAHLSDEERQSVSSLVLTKLVTWMRRQSGTSDLRALLYLDEVAGYLPPTANPPTKKPIMLLLKQARAFGLGVVLSTQNPVDVDYKALSNAGTWLIGRLQTERDKARLVDGLSSAAGDVDVAAVADTISTLGKREFVLRRAGSGSPEVMTTRWAMSYLRGPLTRDQIALLREKSFGGAEAGPSAPGPHPAEDTAAGGAFAPASSAALRAGSAGPGAAGVPSDVPGVAPVVAATPPATGTPTAGNGPGDDESPMMPPVAAGVPVAYLDPAAAWAGVVGAVPGSHLRAAAVARVHLRYDDTRAGLLHDEEYEAVLCPLPQQPDPGGFVAVDYDERDLLPTPPAPAWYGLPVADVRSTTWWTALKRALTDHLVRTRSAEIFVNKDLKAFSRVGESREEFVARCAAVADEKADQATAALRGKYETRLSTLRLKHQDASMDAARLQAQYDADYGVAATVGTLLGGLLGGRRSRSSIAADARRQSADSKRVGAAQVKATSAANAISALESELATEILTIDARWSETAGRVEPMRIPLEKSDVSVAELRLVWVPVA